MYACACVASYELAIYMRALSRSLFFNMYTLFVYKSCGDSRQQLLQYLISAVIQEGLSDLQLFNLYVLLVGGCFIRVYVTGPEKASLI